MFMVQRRAGHGRRAPDCPDSDEDQAGPSDGHAGLDERT